MTDPIPKPRPARFARILTKTTRLITLCGEVAGATTAIKHKPLQHFVVGHRIRVEALVTDPQGVGLVRCYFRAAGRSDYVFVGMIAGEKGGRLR